MNTLLIHNATCIATFDHADPAKGRELKDASLFVRDNVIEVFEYKGFRSPDGCLNKVVVSDCRPDKGADGLRFDQACGDSSGIPCRSEEGIRRCRVVLSVFHTLLSA